jgi:hypothetical protein
MEAITGEATVKPAFSPPTLHVTGLTKVGGGTETMAKAGEFDHKCGECHRAAAIRNTNDRCSGFYT